MLATLTLVLAAATAAGSPPPCAPAKAFTGTICAPAASGKHPAILLLGGSEGGDIMKYTAPRFAKQGYLAASVAYFGLPGLPQTLEEIPLETIGTALADISKRPDVDPNRIAIMGISKGGELALLAASTYPQIHAVVAGVPSPFAWQGIPNGPSAPKSSWTFDGKPLPYVPFSAEMGTVVGEAYSTGQPLDFRKGYEASMQSNAAQIPAAMFRLENIHGPVLLIAADDDQVWDSVAQCTRAMTYLHEHHHPYDDQFLQYAHAGHIFLFASAQQPMISVKTGPTTMLLGGTAQGNLDAKKQAWPKIDAFLSSALP